MAPIIRVENLSKRYILRHAGRRNAGQGGFRHVVEHAVQSAVGRVLRPFRGRAAADDDSRETTEDFWALKDVSFEVEQGECVGIIGRNGAGKSTLLKILSRITEPTAGMARLRGRVGCLLEVGTGFHPELTGRENVFLNGAILGMQRSEVARKFDEIVSFAEVERFIDTPVKHYSSGMYMRLAFSVAAHLEPEILIVDEVLAVGDAEFQKKCLGKMGEVATEGRTVLFVSHNMGAVQGLCQQAVFMRGGQVIEKGPVNQVVRLYSSMAGLTYQTAPDKPYKIVGASIEPFDDKEQTRLHIKLEIHAEAQTTLAVDVRLFDSVGIPVAYGSLGTFAPSRQVTVQPGRTQLQISNDIGQLGVGTYLVSLDLTHPHVKFLDRAEHCLSFQLHGVPPEVGGRKMEQQWGKGSWELPMNLVSQSNSPTGAAAIDG